MKIIVLIISLLFLHPHNLFADNAISISGHILYFDYEEFSDSGVSLNRETGFLPGINLSLDLIKNKFNFTIYNGSVDYDGQTQSGIPHQTDTKETIYRASYRRVFDFNTEQKNNYYAELNYQFWERDIQPNNGVNGLYEEYSWFSFEAGIETILYQDNLQNLKLELGILHSFNSVIHIDLRNSGYGYPELSLAEKPGIHTALTFTNNISESQSLYFKIDYKYWRFGKSNTETVSNGISTLGIYEPRSTSNHAYFAVGLISYF